MKTLNLAFRISCISFMIILLQGCGGDSPNEEMAGAIIPEEQSFEATEQPNTSSVKLSEMGALESYDESTGTYVFENKSALKGIEEGEVVLFEGHSLRRIKSIREENGKIVVTSEFAALTEYYKDAKISYNTMVNWDAEGVAATRVSLGTPVATLRKPLSSSFSGMIQDGSNQSLGVKLEREIRGWKVEFEMEPEAGGKLKIKLVAKKEHRCSITAEGFISNFNSNADIEIANGQPERISYHNRGMEGEIEIKFAAVELGSEIAHLEIPARLERTILVYGVIPVTLRLKANLSIYPEIAVGSSSQVSMKLTYNSDMGFDYEAGRVQSQGDIRNENAEQTGDCNTATAGIAGMGVSVEFPRFEVGILHNVIVPYLVLKTHTSSYLSTGLLDNTPCHFAEIKYDANAGVDLKFLGDASIKYNYKIHEDKKRWIADGSHCD